MSSLFSVALVGVAGALLFLPLFSTRRHRHRHRGPGVLSRRGGSRRGR